MPFVPIEIAFIMGKEINTQMNTELLRSIRNMLVIQRHCSQTQSTGFELSFFG